MLRGGWPKKPPVFDDRRRAGAEVARRDMDQSKSLMRLMMIHALYFGNSGAIVSASEEIAIHQEGAPVHLAQYSGTMPFDGAVADARLRAQQDVLLVRRRGEPRAVPGDEKAYMRAYELNGEQGEAVGIATCSS